MGINPVGDRSSVLKRTRPIYSKSSNMHVRHTLCRSSWKCTVAHCGIMAWCCICRGVLSQFIQNPGQAHWEVLNCIIMYLRCTKDLWLTFGGHSECHGYGYTRGFHTGLAVGTGTGTILLTRQNPYPYPYRKAGSGVYCLVLPQLIWPMFLKN